MVASRTGTAAWKRVRAQAIRRAQRDGLTKCRHCGVELDFVEGRRPNSAWIDHITPHSLGGADHIDNAEAICRTCNLSKGNRDAPTPKKAPKPLKTSRKW